MYICDYVPITPAYQHLQSSNNKIEKSVLKLPQADDIMSLGRRMPYLRRNGWITRLPLEIVTRVLFFVVADALANGEVFGRLPFLDAFPGLNDLILVIKDVPSTTPVRPWERKKGRPCWLGREQKQDFVRERKERNKTMKNFLKGMKCVTLQNYALLPQSYGWIPIKVFVASHDMLSRPTTTTLDRSCFSLLTRFLEPNNFLILPMNSGMMESCRASGAWCFEMADLEPWADRIDVFEIKTPNDSYNCVYFRRIPTAIMIKSQIQITKIFKTELKRLDVIISGIEDTVQPYLLMGSEYPIELLRIRFTSFLLPLMRLTCVAYIGGDEDCVGKPPKHRQLVLENVHWTEETPYGACIQDGKQDQWHWNVDRFDSSWSRRFFRRHAFRQVCLMGIPEFIVALFDWRRVVSLRWWRLSSHKPLQKGDRLPVTLNFPRLQQLIIVSVRRREEFFPRFEAPKLRKLTLSSLVDSTAPWDVADTLAGASPKLKDVYMEHRGELGISLTPQHLDPVASSIQKLHLRGYVPALGGPSVTRFIKLRTMMLDVSRTSTTPSILEDPISLPGKAIIELPQDTFPALQSLTLMCTGREVLTNTHMELTFPPTVRLLQISMSVNPLTITVNKILLRTPPRFEQEDIPIVQSRLCNQYRFLSFSSWGKFMYVKRALIKDNWLQDYKEY